MAFPTSDSKGRLTVKSAPVAHYITFFIVRLCVCVCWSAGCCGLREQADNLALPFQEKKKGAHVRWFSVNRTRAQMGDSA